MNFLPNFGDISKIGGTVNTFITDAKAMLETALVGIKTIGENQIKSHKEIIDELDNIRTEMRSYFDAKESKDEGQ